MFLMSDQGDQGDELQPEDSIIDPDEDLMADDADGPCEAEDFIAAVDDAYFDFMPVDAGGRLDHLDDPYRDFIPKDAGGRA